MIPLIALVAADPELAVTHDAVGIDLLTVITEIALAKEFYTNLAEETRRLLSISAFGSTLDFDYFLL